MILRLKQRLHELGVDTIAHYPIPPHLSRAYTSAGELVFRPRELPLAEQLAATVLSLPLDPFLDELDVVEVVERIRVAIKDLAV